jgi:tetratricopeptide (TPR) repeat protein
MISKFFKLISIYSLTLCFQIICIPNSLAQVDFDEKNIANYFSGSVSLNNNNNFQAVKYFNSTKNLKNTHENFNRNYIISLVLDGKVSKSVSELKATSEQKYSNFFNLNLILILEEIKRNNFDKAKAKLINLEKFEQDGKLEFVLYRTIKRYTELFLNKKTSKNDINELGNIGEITNAFEKCYLGEMDTEKSFINLINSDDGDFSRYLFFYVNYLISNGKFELAKKHVLKVNFLNSNLITAQTKQWILEENYKDFSKIFSCKNHNHLISEFLYLIANLYSSEGYYMESNFYLKLSHYMNPRFNFNLSLLLDNYLEINKIKEAKEIINKFKEKNESYYWYGLKQQANIISDKEGEKKAFEFIKSKFNKINNPNIKLKYDLANFAKNSKLYEISIKYYSEILKELDNQSNLYAKILYRRGGSYERIGNYKKADDDLLNSLNINSNDPYVMNYLGYSWLERNINIKEAFILLEKANKKKKDDPYITDSIGWAYYLTGNFNKAEKFLRKAVLLMPDDPIVNDHYGDILWKLNRKIEARYFWKNVLKLEETEAEMRNKIKQKLIIGLEDA